MSALPEKFQIPISCLFQDIQCLSFMNKSSSPALIFRLCLVHTLIEEKDLQVPIWPVCMDAHDTYCGVYTICFYCRQYI